MKTSKPDTVAASFRYDRARPLPLYAQLAEHLSALISGGAVAAGAALPGELALSRALGLSRCTVRRALAELAAAGMVRIRHGAPTTAAVPDRPAGPAFGNDAGARRIALVVPSFNNEIYPALHAGAAAVAAARGYEIQLAVARSDRRREAELLEGLAAARVAGVIIEPCHAQLDTPDTENYRLLRDLPVPMVIVGGSIAGLDRSRIVIDDSTGGRIATEHIIAHGHRRIAYVYKNSVSAAVERRSGYRVALSHAGIAHDYRLELGFTEAEETANPGGALTMRLLALDDPPSAIFFYNDETACAAMDALAARGLQPGRDLSIVACDNTSSAQRRGLCSLDHPKSLIGRWAADLLFDLIAAGDGAIRRSLVVQPELVRRPSLARIDLPSGLGAEIL